MFGSFGWMELMLILIIVLIIFGAGKLPQLGEGLGKAIKGFKKSVHEAEALEESAQEEVFAQRESAGQPAPAPQGEAHVSTEGQPGEPAQRPVERTGRG